MRNSERKIRSVRCSVPLINKLINKSLSKDVVNKGTEYLKYCPVCGSALLREGDRYCSDCGQKLSWK